MFHQVVPHLRFSEGAGGVFERQRGVDARVEAIFDAPAALVVDQSAQPLLAIDEVRLLLPVLRISAPRPVVLEVEKQAIHIRVTGRGRKPPP